ncbi:MAG TPA: dephospho-CoA kinase [Spirochaetia bacterium]|nr:dephospho-CoA kinase [Spirochaetia bacterium]
MVVGVTGKYCAGKNLVTEILSTRGFESIDVDRLGHRALEERKAEVVDAFGSVVLSSSGEIDRRRLGALVFADQRELSRLESITHPVMVAEVAEIIKQGENHDFVVNAAILFRMGLHLLCDMVLWVEAPLPTRVARALRRDRLPLFEVVKRIWTQRKLSPQPFRNYVDIYNVRNSGNRDKLEAVVLSLIETS